MATRWARRRRDLLAFAPLALALVIEWGWPYLVDPYHWFLFYPAAFFSSWLGGRWLGIGGTVVTTALVWWLFIDPKSANEVLPALVFCTMGIFFAVFHDRLRAANARMKKLADERHVFVALIENSSDFIGIADPDGTPIYVNPAGRRMVGLAPEVDVRATRIPEYYAEDQRAFAEGVILKNMIERGHWKGETYFRNWKTGEPIPVSDEHFVIREPASGRTLGMGTVTRDITELRRARDEMEKANRMLERAIAARDEVLGVVAHDLRNPLNAIVLQASLIRAEPISRAAKRMNRMIQDLLDVARLEAGRTLGVDRVAIAAAPLVRDLVEDQKPLAAAAKLELVADVSDGEIWADRARVQQILENLVGNAIKFTPAGGRVTISAHAGEREVAFCVADTGSGISSHAKEHLFDRFWQADATDRRGMGVGLSLAKVLVEEHGGRIWVESEPGHGTRVHFTLPTPSRAAVAV